MKLNISCDYQHNIDNYTLDVSLPLYIVPNIFTKFLNYVLWKFWQLYAFSYLRTLLFTCPQKKKTFNYAIFLTKQFPIASSVLQRYKRCKEHESVEGIQSCEINQLPADFYRPSLPCVVAASLTCNRFGALFYILYWSIFKNLPG